MIEVIIAFLFILIVRVGLPTHMAVVLFVGVTLRVGLIKAGFFLGYRGEIDMAKGSPYECGFDPIRKAWYPMPMRFFHMVLLFVL